MMSDFMELALRRQSCRNFDGRPVDHELLVKLVEAGRLAPSGCNAQPWSFVVVETPELVREVAKCAQQIGMNPFLDNAGAFVVVLEEHAVLVKKIRGLIDSQYFAKGDLGAANAYIALEAASLGLGVCQLGIYDRERLCELLNIPMEKQFAGLIAIGHPVDETIRVKQRKNLDEIARFM